MKNIFLRTEKTQSVFHIGDAVGKLHDNGLIYNYLTTTNSMLIGNY